MTARLRLPYAAKASVDSAANELQVAERELHHLVLRPPADPQVAQVNSKVYACVSRALIQLQGAGAKVEMA